MSAGLRASWLVLPLLGGWLASSACRPADAARDARQGAHGDAVYEPAAHGRAEHCSYSFAVDERLTQLEATLCCEHARLSALEPTDDVAATLLRSAARVAPDGSLLEPARRDGRGAVRFDQRADAGATDETAPDCAQYVVDLARATRRRGGLLGARRREGALLISPDLWLWRPEPLPARLVARFELPNGIDVAVPWIRSRDGYEIPASAWNFRGQSAFGRLRRSELALAGTQVDLVGVGQTAPSLARLQGWLAEAGQAVATIHGRLPAERALLLVLGESGRRRGFGLTLRGGGPNIVMLLGDTADGADSASLRGDWTAVHELLHLGLPPTDPSDAWLSEGLTTYYTTLSRARSGFLSREQAWHELLDGFERGRRTGTGRTLREESAAMHQSGAYWRVYWAGTALALLADVELRRSGARDGLDGPLREVARCCADSGEIWDSERLARELDRHAPGPIWRRLAARYLDEQAFPEVEQATSFLGVKLNGNGVELDAGAPGASMREAIVARKHKK